MARGSLANWHPHLHMLVTDGGFRLDGTFVRLPLHDATTLTEAFRRAVLKLFVKRELMDVGTAQGMLAWPHSGFHVHDAVWAAADDKALTVRLARYCARNPIALGRMQYHKEDSTVTYHSDKPTGPTAGSETVDALEFLARVVSHIPNKGQVLQRYYGWYASRVRGMRRKATEADADYAEHPLVIVDPEPEAVRQARHRWAELLRRIFTPHLRGRSARLSPLRRTDAHSRAHHRAQDHRSYPGAPATHRANSPAATRSAQTLAVPRHDHLGLATR